MATEKRKSKFQLFALTLLWCLWKKMNPYFPQSVMGKCGDENMLFNIIRQNNENRDEL